MEFVDTKINMFSGQNWCQSSTFSLYHYNSMNLSFLSYQDFKKKLSFIPNLNFQDIEMPKCCHLKSRGPKLIFHPNFHLYFSVATLFIYFFHFDPQTFLSQKVNLKWPRISSIKRLNHVKQKLTNQIEKQIQIAIHRELCVCVCEQQYGLQCLLVIC